MIDHSTLANLEVAWWQGHHRKDEQKVVVSLTQQFMILFNLTQDQAMKAAMLKLQAGHEHDLAEHAEDNGFQESARKHWTNAEELLKEHFKIIVGQQNQSK